MIRKKKKNTSFKAASNIKKQDEALKNRFTERIQQLIIWYAGEEMLQKIPDVYIEHLFTCRYPVLKAKAAPDANISKTRIIQFNKLINQMVGDTSFKLKNGNEVPLSWYVSEGLTLVDAMTTAKESNNSVLIELSSYFKDYFPDTEPYREIQNMLEDITVETCRLLNDYNDCIFRADLSETPFYARFNPKNDILVYASKPEPVQLSIEGNTRKAIRLSWIDSEFKWVYFKVKPSLLGFSIRGMDIPLDLYIQHHALDRLRERINITPGIMHEILFYTFLEKNITHHYNGYYSLVEYRVSDLKTGYFLVKLHTDKLVIHTFLFLTNDRTPEGEKLGRLVETEKEDKKYLQIDNLPHFNSYHFDKDEKLSKLFKDAGCGSLLKLGHLQKFTANQIKDKDPDSIIHYLADAAYFRKNQEKIIR